MGSATRCSKPDAQWHTMDAMVQESLPCELPCRKAGARHEARHGARQVALSSEEVRVFRVIPTRYVVLLFEPFND
jgi:hypothetical protein